MLKVEAVGEDGVLRACVALDDIDEDDGSRTWRNTYAQYQASASGRALTCIANPFFAGQSDDPYAYQNRPRTLTPGYAPGYYAPR